MIILCTKLCDLFIHSCPIYLVASRKSYLYTNVIHCIFHHDIHYHYPFVFYSISKLRLNLAIERCKWSCISQHQIFFVEDSLVEYVVENIMFKSYYLSFVFSSTMVSRTKFNIQWYCPFFIKAFTQVRHSSHPGHGNGYLACHMTQFVQSERLRSENFINIMKKFNIGSGNGLVPSDKKTLPEPLLTQI